jgi:anti-sigma regulatory factor (Ser/Thr protein kinase)
LTWSQDLYPVREAFVLVKSLVFPGTPLPVAEYHAQFPSAYESVGRARRAIIAFAGEWFAGDDLNDIESAAGEALANCAEHGHKNGTNIDVVCRCDGNALSIEIKDAGQGFDRWNARDYVKPLSSAPRGYGTYIMRRLMDEIEYTDLGTRICLTKRLRPDKAADAGDRGKRFG